MLTSQATEIINQFKKTLHETEKMKNELDKPTPVSMNQNNLYFQTCLTENNLNKKNFFNKNNTNQ